MNTYTLTPYSYFVRDASGSQYENGKRMLSYEFSRTRALILQEVEGLRDRTEPLSVHEQENLLELFALMLKLHAAAHRR